MTRKPHKRKEAICHKRRIEVAALIVGGFSYREIAKKLGTSIATISRDYGVIREEWRRELNSEDIQAWRILELAKLSVMERAIAGKVRSGDILAIKQQLSLMKYRAELLGLYAAIRHEHTGRAGQPIELEVAGGDLSHVPQADLEQAMAEVDRILGKGEG